MPTDRDWFDLENLLNSGASHKEISRALEAAQCQAELDAERARDDEAVPPPPDWKQPNGQPLCNPCLGPTSCIHRGCAHDECSNRVCS